MATNTKAYLALAFVSLAWGTTYLAIKVGVMHYPPFLFAGARQLLAGIVLIVLARTLNKEYDYSIKNIGRQMLIGFLMLSLGNGCVTWGEKAIPSGIAALICSMMPIFAVGYNLLATKGEKLNGFTGLGMLLGIFGVGLIFRQDVQNISNPAYLLGILAVLFATSSWAMGSIINKKNLNPVNPFLNSGMQLFFGGLFMVIASPVLDSYQKADWLSREGFFSFVYLLIFGSVGAYAAYMYALSKLPVGIATIYAYINPLVAVILGYFIMNEPINLFTILAFITIIISVFLVNFGYRKQHKSNIALKENNTSETFPESFPVES